MGRSFCLKRTKVTLTPSTNAGHNADANGHRTWAGDRWQTKLKRGKTEPGCAYKRSSLLNVIVDQKLGCMPKHACVTKGSSRSYIALRGSVFMNEETCAISQELCCDIWGIIQFPTVPHTMLLPTLQKWPTPLKLYVKPRYPYPARSILFSRCVSCTCILKQREVLNSYRLKRPHTRTRSFCRVSGKTNKNAGF